MARNLAKYGSDAMNKISPSKPNRIDNNSNQKKRQKLLAYTASITLQNNKNTEIHNKDALLQVNVIKEQHESDKLSAIFAELQQKFKHITILIDMHLASLTLKIIMPHMQEEQIKKMAEQMKEKWLTNNMHIISRINVPWTITTSTDNPMMESDELLKNSIEFGNHITGDAKSLISYLSHKHDVSGHDSKNIATAETYIINIISSIATVNSLNNYDYAYISYNNIHTYDFLQKNQKNKLPSHYYTITVTKNDKAELFVTKEDINKFSYATELNDIAKQHICLESFAKYFPGCFYIQSLARTVLGCNNRQALEFGVRDAGYIAGKTLDELFSKHESEKIAETANEITTAYEAKTIVETYTFLGKRRTYLSIKTPLKNKNNTMLGIIGFSLAATDSGDPGEKLKLSTINKAQEVIQDAITKASNG